MGKISIQDILYYGYIYLLLIGIASESVYFGILDVEVLWFANILDLLLTPLEHLTDNMLFTTVILGFPVLLYPLIKWAHKRRQTVSARTGRSSIFQLLTARQWWAGVSMVVVLCTYMGFAIHGALTVKEDLHRGNIVPNHLLTFDGQDPLPVNLLGINGEFVFYIESGKKVITVSPVSVSLVKIEKMPAGVR